MAIVKGQGMEEVTSMLADFLYNSLICGLLASAGQQL